MPTSFSKALPSTSRPFSAGGPGPIRRRDVAFLKREVDAAGALRFLAQRPDFCVAPKNGLAIGPRKRWNHLTWFADGRAGGRLIAQVRPLKVEGVSVLDPDAPHHIGSRASERRLGTLVTVDIQEGDFFAREDH